MKVVDIFIYVNNADMLCVFTRRFRSQLRGSAKDRRGRGGPGYLGPRGTKKGSSFKLQQISKKRAILLTALFPVVFLMIGENLSTAFIFTKPL